MYIIYIIYYILYIYYIYIVYIVYIIYYDVESYIIIYIYICARVRHVYRLCHEHQGMGVHQNRHVDGIPHFWTNSYYIP